MKKSALSPIERFWSKVDKSGDCWVWTGYIGSGGYGSFGNSIGCGSKTAHRISYELANGPIPAGLVICHKCDNRKCVNPSHLWADTQKANVHDRIAKGRRNRTDHSNTCSCWACFKCNYALANRPK